MRRDDFTIKAADRNTSRIINQRAIINYVYQNNGVSKTELARELGLSKPAVSQHVSRLISLDLIVEKGEGEASKNGGRKPIMLYFNGSFRYIAAIDLSFHEPICAIGDMLYNFIGTEQIKIDRGATPEEKREQVWRKFEKIMKEHNISTQEIGVVVISHPGIIDKNGEEYFSEEHHHVWTRIQLKQYLHEKFKVPIVVKNDVNLAAIGEFNFNQKLGLRDLIYVSCGLGFGVGIIINDRLYEGRNNAAGELGLTVQEDGKRVEETVALNGLMKAIKQIDKGNEKMTFGKIIELSKAEDPYVNRVLNENGRKIGRMIYNCCGILDIQTVIFGGDYLKLGSQIIDGIETELKQFLPFAPKLFLSDLKENAGLYGCFVVGKSKILQELETV